MDRVCKECQKECKCGDFLHEKTYPNVCYRCLYQIKMAFCPKKSSCKICKGTIPRGNWVYCSEECRTIGTNDLKKNYWVFKTPSLGMKWN